MIESVNGLSKRKMRGKGVSNLVGKTFSNWTVLEYQGVNKHGKHFWLCRCSCSIERNVEDRRLRKGISKICGLCLPYKKHGHTSSNGSCSTEYSTWIAMKKRCFDKNNGEYHNYGGRGITVCDRWLGKNGFVNFLADMGEKPSKNHSIDRKDNNRSYFPENCRWATKKEQSRNRRNNSLFVYKEKEYTIPELSEISGIKIGTLYTRLQICGWDITRAIETPVKKKNKK